MRKLAAAILIAVLPSLAFAAPAAVQNTSSIGNTGASAILTLSAAVYPGDLVIGATTGSTTAYPASVADSSGVAFTERGNYGTTANATAIWDYQARFAPTLTISSGISHPIGVAVDSSGNIYSSNDGNNTITKYASSGGSPTLTISSGINGPFGVAVDSSGNIYSSNYGNGTITKYASSGGSPTLTISSGINSPIGVAVDSSGNIYSANNGNSTITKYASSGGSPTLTISSGISHPFGVAVDSSGNIYSSNNGNNTITKYASSGGSPTLTISSGINGAAGVAVDSSGNIYSANFSNSTITKYASSGGSPTLTISSGISNPQGVAVDSSGNIYSANYGNYTITKYASGINYTCAGASSACLDFALIEVSGAVFSQAGAGYTTAQTTAGAQGSLMVCALGQPATSTATGITISNSTGQTNVLTDAESSSSAGIFASYAFNSTGTTSSCSASNSGNANIVLANYAANAHGLLKRGIGYDFTQPRARVWDSRLQDLYTMGVEAVWQGVDQ